MLMFWYQLGQNEHNSFVRENNKLDSITKDFLNKTLKEYNEQNKLVYEHKY